MYKNLGTRKHKKQSLFPTESLGEHNYAWYWRWFDSLFSLHSADSFAIFCLWYWDWVASLFFLDSEDSFAHFFSLFRSSWASLFSLDSSLPFTLLHFSYSCQVKTFASFSYVVFGFFYFWKANVQFLDSHEHFANQVHYLWQRHL